MVSRSDAGISPNDRGLAARVFDWAVRRKFERTARALQVQRRFVDLRGDQLAAALTLRCFVAIFPLVLAGIAIIGTVTASSADFPNRLIDALGLHGSGAETVRSALATAAKSRRVTGVISVLGLLWTGLGVTTSLRSVCNQCWQVEEAGPRDKIVGAVWAGGLALAMIAQGVAASWFGSGSSILTTLATLISGVMLVVLSLLTLMAFTNVVLPARRHAPGAILLGVGLALLQVIGAVVVPRLVLSASQLYGTLGVVFALIAWLHIFARVLVYACVLNVVLYERNCGVALAIATVPKLPGVGRRVGRSGRAQSAASK